MNVISAGAFTHGTYLSMYCSAKAAVLQLTRAMAAEFVGRGIRANALAPGTTDTDMVRNNDEAAQQRMVDAALIKRMAAPEEIANGALFLASDASSFMTGQCLVLDGGMTTTLKRARRSGRVPCASSGGRRLQAESVRVSARRTAACPT